MHQLGNALACSFREMARARRIQTAGLTFHVVNRSAKRLRLFGATADYEAFERCVAEGLGHARVALFAYCVMPNHWHLLLSPQADMAMSRFMHWLTTTHAKRWQTVREKQGQGAVYQGRYQAIPISNDRHFLWVCRYIERNALRAGLVRQAEHWRWSSLAEPPSPLASTLSAWPTARPTNWIELVNRPQTEGELAAFRSAVRHGQPFGTDEWRSEVRRLTGMRTARPRGRPRKTVLFK